MTVTGANISPIAQALLQYKLPNGQFLIPFADYYTPTRLNFPENAFIPGTAYFLSNQAVADLDFIATSKDTLALKYYYQHDPSIAPYGYSSVAGFHSASGRRKPGGHDHQYADLERRV